MRVLVLDGHENQAVACVRSLARAGHRVFVGAESPWPKAGLSRWSSGTFLYPSPERDAVGFVRRVAEQVARERGTLVLPVTERSTLPLSRDRDLLLSAGARLVLPLHERVLQAFDKQRTTALAASLGITVPRTHVLAGEAVEARSVAASAPYPVVLKPRTSEEASRRRVRSAGAPRYARDPEQFMAAWHQLRRRCSAILVQEFVEGTGAGYFALVRHGDVRAEFAHRRIRDVRPTGSGSALRESVPVDRAIGAQSRALLAALHWHGVAMVEFRVRSDGTPVFLEVNGRFWNSLALAVYAGVDFPAMLAELAERGDVATRDGYAPGLRSRWLLGDFRHLVEVWRGAPAGYPGPFPRRWRTLAAFLMPTRGMYHDNFMWKDPLPELGDWLHFFGRKLPVWLAARDTRVHGTRRPAHP
jgi:predicted ATP-grasp superfamily ATP-dependent carboligase